jgi:hypothetical protein
MRAIGWILVLVGAGFLAVDAVSWLHTGGIVPTPLGRIWFSIDRFSLNLMQAVIERYVAAALWQSVIGPALLYPGWAVFPALGAAVLALARLFRRRSR